MQDIVSVIIPVYNGEKTIENAVRSALAQTYIYIEIIVVDDCSNDRTPLIMKQLVELDPRVIYWKNKENKGVAATRNFGISRAQGRYIAFLDSDDEWYPQKLETQIRFMQKNEVDICYSAYLMINKQTNSSKRREVPAKVEYRDLLRENTICCSTVILRKEMALKHPFREEFFHEDFILWLELLKKGYKAMGINQILVNYHTGGRSADKINAIYYRWLIYRRCEKMDILHSLYYFIFYGINGIKKYYLKSDKPQQNIETPRLRG